MERTSVSTSPSLRLRKYQYQVLLTKSKLVRHSLYLGHRFKYNGCSNASAAYLCEAGKITYPLEFLSLFICKIEINTPAFWVAMRIKLDKVPSVVSFIEEPLEDAAFKGFSIKQFYFISYERHFIAEIEWLIALPSQVGFLIL